MEISKRVVRASISSQVHILVGFAGHTITIKISRSTFPRSYVVLLREPLFAQVFDRLSTHVWVRGGGGGVGGGANASKSRPCALSLS